MGELMFESYEIVYNKPENEDKPMKVRVKTDQFKGIELNEVKDYQDLTPLQQFCVDNEYPCFEVVEDFEVGDWIYGIEDNSVSKITKYNDGGDGWIKCFGVDPDFGWYDSARLYIGDKDEFRKATPKEIEQALIKEAKRRGYNKAEKWKPIYDTPVKYWYPSCIGDRGFGYDHEDDILSFGQVIVYKKGKWAEIIEDDPITINGYEVKIGDNYVKIGCRTMSQEHIGWLADIVKSENIGITNYNDENISHKIIKIAHRISEQKKRKM